MNVSYSNCSVAPAEYQQRLFPAVYSLVFVLGLPGNLVALSVFVFKVGPRTSFGVYFINLTLADTAILLTLPFHIHYHVNGNHWVFGDLACRVAGTLFYANIYSSVCFMSCICVDRYIATVYPHTYLRMRSSHCSVRVSLLIWGVLCLAVASFILMGPLKTAESAANGVFSYSCFENFALNEWGRRVAPYSVLSLVFCALLPSSIILVCYPLAARRITRIGTKTARRAVRVIYTIMAITLLCFLPYHLMYLLHMLRRLGAISHCPYADAIHNARHVTKALVTINTCLDPLIYFAATNHFQWKPSRLRWLWGRLRRTTGVYTITRI